MSKQIKNFKKVLDKMGFYHREISLNDSKPKRTHIKVGFSLNIFDDTPSILEIENFVHGGKRFATDLIRRKIIEYNNEIKKLADKLVSIQNSKE